MKKLFRIFLLILLALGGVLAVASWKLGQYLTPEALVTELEKNINSRVQIESVNISLFSSPARVAVKGLALGVRDGEVSKPYGERTPMKGAPVTVEEVDLAVNLKALLDQQIDVKELRIRKPEVTMLFFEEEGNSLDVLFKSPDDHEEETTSPSSMEKDEGSETFHRSQLSSLKALEGVSLEDGTINIVIEKTGLVLRLEELHLALNDLALDQGESQTIPTVELGVRGNLQINSPAKDNERYGVIGFDGVAMADLFDPETGNLAIAAETEVDLNEDSYLGTNIPVVQKAWGGLQKLEQVGVKIGPLPGKATFGESRVISLYYEDERIVLRKPLSLILDDWHLSLEQESWIQMEKELHGANAVLMARQKLSDKAREQLGNGVENLPREIRPKMISAIEDAWFRNGRLFARIVSEGELSKPSLDVINKMPDLERVAKDAAKEYAKERLKKLFDR